MNVSRKSVLLALSIMLASAIATLGVLLTTGGDTGSLTSFAEGDPRNEFARASIDGSLPDGWSANESEEPDADTWGWSHDEAELMLDVYSPVYTGQEHTRLASYDEVIGDWVKQTTTGDEDMEISGVQGFEDRTETEVDGYPAVHVEGSYSYEATTRLRGMPDAGVARVDLWFVRFGSKGDTSMVVVEATDVAEASDDHRRELEDLVERIQLEGATTDAAADESAGSELPEGWETIEDVAFDAPSWMDLSASADSFTDARGWIDTESGNAVIVVEDEAGRFEMEPLVLSDEVTGVRGFDDATRDEIDGTEADRYDGSYVVEGEPGRVRRTTWLVDRDDVGYRIDAYTVGESSPQDAGEVAQVVVDLVKLG